MKKIIVGSILFVLLTAAFASGPVSAFTLDKASESLNPIEQRVQNIKEFMEDVNINKIIEDNIPEQKCIFLYYLLGLLGIINFSWILFTDLIIFLIIVILSGG